MRPSGRPGDPIATFLAPLAATGADAGQVAQAAVAVWVKVRAALAPVIGQGGVAALFNRTIFLASPERPWLLPAHGAGLDGEFASLRAVLAQQDSAAAASAHDAMVAILLDLLGKLIGPSLTDRLLLPVWPSPSAGDAVQDTMP